MLFTLDEVLYSIKCIIICILFVGTTERVCLITGCFESVKKAHEFIIDRIREKTDPNPKPVDGDLKVNFERHKQVS